MASRGGLSNESEDHSPGCIRGGGAYRAARTHLPGNPVQPAFGEELAATELIVGRFTGIAPIGLDIPCWPGRDSRQSYRILTYSTLAMLYLALLGVRGTGGVLFWPRLSPTSRSSRRFSGPYRLQGRNPHKDCRLSDQP